MQNVIELYNLVPVEGDLGLEIEVEGNNLPDTNAFWRKEQDGSLRGESAEYVFKKPLSMSKTRKALEYLGKSYLVNESRVIDSVRAGVHVHVNVQNLTSVQLFNYIILYVLLEDIFIKYCGENREGNLFCLRTRDAELLLKYLERTAIDKNWHRFSDETLRYASMNVCSLSKFGSLEFRAMRGTADLGLIGDWAEMLLNLRNTAMEFESPEGILGMLNANGPESFCKQILGDFFHTLTDGMDYQECLHDGLLRVSPIINLTNWNSFTTIDIGGLQFPADVEFPDEPMQDW